MIKQCEYCGKKFKTDCGHQKYCSRECGSRGYYRSHRANDVTIKQCPVCGVEFEAHHGLRKYCSQYCKTRSGYMKHREERKAYNREYYAAHREEKLAYNHAYYAANREAINAWARKQRRIGRSTMMKHCECCGAMFEPDKNHTWQKYCSRRCAEYTRYMANRERILERQREYHEANREEINAWARKCRRSRAAQ